MIGPLKLALIMGASIGAFFHIVIPGVRYTIQRVIQAITKPEPVTITSDQTLSEQHANDRPELNTILVKTIPLDRIETLPPANDTQVIKPARNDHMITEVIEGLRGLGLKKAQSVKIANAVYDSYSTPPTIEQYLKDCLKSLYSG